ncbi:MAG: NAD(P)H-hydrate epimerase, partial [Candidatus Omnitrophota bacterium]
KTGKPIYALDVPSGMNATTGEVSPDCVKAHKTITFGLLKSGFGRNPEAKKHLGKVVVKNIGFPAELLRKK